MSHHPSPTKPDPQTSQPAARQRRNQRTLLIGWALLCVLALIVFFVRSSGGSDNRAIDRADPADTQLVTQGQQLYTTRCAGCHGLDLRGEAGWPEPRADGTLPASPLDGSGTAWQRDDGWLFRTIKDGGQATASPGVVSTMPAFGSSLSDAEIWAIVSYIKSTWPPETRSAQPATP
jgi:mono/diheme cytochrome c family protein